MYRAKLKLVVIAAACCVAWASATPAAPPEGKGKPDNAGQGQGNNGNGNNKGKGDKGQSSKDKGGDSHDGGGNVTLRYAGITLSTAQGYAREYGLSGYSSLPPGIRKNLARGKPLPPGIAKKMVPAPMLARLPVYPGYEWQVAGTDLILVAVATAVVADVLLNVFD
ncbi:anti-virulence regulator CigR family protein [Achromobacter sp. NPDC008082]|uniref:anti-virulence regulator CigR family protein n=1 Tax=Achromobacter sp. NPDC008082 TaxID=3363888 RepID=UPI0036EAE9DC